MIKTIINTDKFDIDIKKVFIKFIIATICFSFIALSFSNVYDVAGLELSKWDIERGEYTETVIVPYTKQIDESGIYTFTTEFIPEKSNENVLVISKMNGYAFEIYFDDILIEAKGDMANPTANLWNYTHVVKLENEIELNRVHNIRINVYGLHDIGFSHKPYITTNSKAIRKATLQNLLSNDLNFLLMGVDLFVGVILLIISFHQPANRYRYVTFAIAAITLGIYNFDFTYRLSTGTLEQYFWIRKIIMICLVISVNSLFQSIYWSSKAKRLPRYAYIITLVSILAMILAPNFQVISKIVLFNSAIISLVVTGIIFILNKELVEKLAFTLFFLYFCIIHTIIILVFRINANIMLNIGFFTLLMSFAILIINDFLKVTIDNKVLANISKTDKLTGAYNRRYMNEINFTKSDILVFIDVDNFKQLNDTMGHDKGDEILRKIVSYSKEIIRMNDIVMRYGGDEFIIIFKKSSHVAVQRVLESIEEYVEENFSIIGISYGVSCNSDNILDAVSIADKNMYKMKNLKKDQN